MVAILLTILKVIGIVLASILGLILLILLVVLFWPVFYRIKIVKKEQFLAQLRISFFFHFITAIVQYDNKPIVKVKILGIPIYKKDLTEVAKPKEDENTEAEATNTETTEETNKKEEEISVINSENVNTETQDKDLKKEEENSEENSEEKEREEEEEFDQLSFFGKLKSFFQKLKELILQIRDKCYNIKDSFLLFLKRVKKIKNDIQYYYKVLQHPSTALAWNLCRTEVWKLLRHIRPKRVRSTIRFGSGDPASTADIYGYYCMIYPFYGKQIHFTPDFENKVFEADAIIKGHIRTFTLLMVAWKLYKDKNLRRVIRLLKREEKKRGRKQQ